MERQASQRTVAVVAVDFLSRSPTTPVEVARGLLLFAPRPEMHLLNVRGVPAGPSGPSEAGDSPESRVLTDISDEVAALADLGASINLGTPIRTMSHVRVGDRVREILSLAAAVEADFIVLGHHERGLSAHRLLQGLENVEGEVRRTARCPVFVADPDLTRPKAEERPASPRGKAK
jgi:nucleotide-binding universal stress UspA family protein